MTRHSQPDVVGIGASAGGVEALRELFRHLPVEFPARLAVVIHRSPTATSRLAAVLSREGLPAVEPEDGDPFISGRIYVAPPDRHMTIHRDRLTVHRGPKHHHNRPAIDLLFSSLAAEFGPRVVGLLLTGNLSDGVAGLIDIKNRGGTCIVQDPAEAPFPSMPLHALEDDHVDMVARIAALPRVLQALVGGGGPDAAVASGATLTRQRAARERHRPR